MDQAIEQPTFSEKGVALLSGALILAGLYISSLYSYPLFHTLVEVFSVGVAFAIFMLTWNSRRYHDNGYLQFIGIMYFFVGAFDLVHALAYKGMNIFRGYDANLPTQLWIAGRYLQSISLFIAPLAIGRRLNYAALTAVYSGVGAITLLAIFSGVFPVSYVEGFGLTPFKIYSEYAISAVLIGSAAHLLLKRRHFDERILKLLLSSIVFVVAAELTFTFYVSVYGLSNLIGHYFKLVAYYLTYRAIVVTGLMKPYDLLFRNLKGSEEALEAERDAVRRLNENLEQRVAERTLELKAANEKLREEIAGREEIERHITAKNALLKLLGETASRKEYIEKAVRVICGWSGCRHAGIRMVNGDGTVPYAAHVGFDREFLESENCLILGRDECICTRVIAGETEPQDASLVTPYGSFHCEDLPAFMVGLSEAERARFRGVCARSGFVSLAVVPIRYGEKVVAEAHLADERRGMVPEKLVTLLEAMTPLIGEAIHKLDAEMERARLVASIESAAEGFVVTSGTGRIEYANPAFERTTGYSREEAIGRSIHLLDSGEQDEEFYQRLRETLRGEGVWSGHLINRKKDGTLYHEECTISTIRDATGEVANYAYVKRDVTEKMRFESIAEAVNTMNNIGYVFSGIRHEIGNPVNSIKTTLGLLRANLDRYSKPAIREYIEMTLEELSGLEYLLKGLKTFNMYEHPVMTTVEVTPFLKKLVALVADDFAGKGIAIEVSVDPDAELCSTDPRALQQVLMNILANSSDACEGREGSRITLRVARKSGMISIGVEDNGIGMSGEQVRELFKPFYTTKKGGTGLGLVIAKKMLMKMNGSIDVCSELGKGTGVEILIPEGRGGG